MLSYNNKITKMMKIAALLTLATIAMTKHHHHHKNSTADPQVEEISWDDLSVSQKSWNVAGTLSLVKEFEGLRLNAYQDSVGVWTIGYGHTGSDVYKGLAITQAKADSLLQADLGKFNTCVSTYINRALNGNQVGALMSWSFNVGCGALQSSTLRTRMNAGEDLNTVAA